MAGRLVLVLGDQLDRGVAAFDGFDRGRDAIWMAEVAEESTHVWSPRPRIAVFLAAMRHFRDALRPRADRCSSTRNSRPGRGRRAADLAGALRASLARAAMDGRAARAAGHRRAGRLARAGALARSARSRLASRWRSAPTGTSSRTRDEFAEHARGRKQLRLEYFYRPLRRQKFGVLMDGGEPAGGQWNYDAENRGAFPKGGPGALPAPARFVPDAVTREVIDLVNTRFADHPGSLARLRLARHARRRAARRSTDFIAHRLP